MFGLGGLLFVHLLDEAGLIKGNIMNSTQTVLKEHTGYFGIKRSLVHITKGIEPAGSGTRDTGECWLVKYELRSGQTGGKRYSSKTDAENEFIRVIA